jgi:16S rRNA (uracil1498-N3)-methyltransferase
MDRVAAWNKNVAFLVGPEGGWSPEEDSLLDRCCEDYPKSIMSVTLGSNVLRTETASILAVGSFSLWFDQKQMC